MQNSTTKRVAKVVLYSLAAVAIAIALSVIIPPLFWFAMSAPLELV